LALAIALAMLASMLKITTAAIWLAPAIVLLHRSKLAAFGIVGSSLAAGLAWTTYTDAMKSGSAAMQFLLSTNLHDWTFGSINQRLDPVTWLGCAAWVAGIGIPVLLGPFVVRPIRIGLWALATFLLGPLTFTNLYFVHDYYWMAVAPAGAILVGIVFNAMFKTEPAQKRAIGLLALGFLFLLSYVAYPRWTAMFSTADPDGVLAQAATIRAASNPSDLVAIDQESWSPAVLFYADRRGYMEYPGIPPAPESYLHFKCPKPGQPGLCVLLPAQP
jgi:hypothetical protein